MTSNDSNARTGAPGPGAPETVPTGPGDARITWYHAPHPALTLAVSHGAGGGIGARDLQALAATLPPNGVTVALVEQPWRVAGKKLAPAPKTLDAGWRDLWPALTTPGLPVIAGGRSAGARVACRTAHDLGAHAVLALAFPLHPPGRPDRSRAGELLGARVPTLVVQGGNDPFGHPEEFPDGAHELVPVPSADHSFAVPKRAPVTQDETLLTLTDAVVEWTARLR
ncbi:hydrolase [Streptomyces uncialis]|uniref:alpha/beta hydrolase family protein n=1 Tax=Streptomyces uncialis TaxID=1048205 RepID=UPI002E2F5803|nr:alpha/beta family hydrolase [Streptomyces uncialis]